MVTTIPLSLLNLADLLFTLVLAAALFRLVRQVHRLVSHSCLTRYAAF